MVIRLKNYKICRGISRYIGLMFSLKFKKRWIFEFKKEGIYPVHMLFVFFPIDLIYLDKNKRVVEIKENLKPFSYYKPRNRAIYVIELERDFIKKNNIKIKDKIGF